MAETHNETPTRHDSRSGLPDRDSFYRQVSPMLSGQTGSVPSLVLLVIDLDGLDLVLRTFGPNHRDQLIRDIGNRIHENVPEEWMPFHVAQGRFAVVIPESTYLIATRTANRLVQSLRKSFDVDGVPYQMNARAGISHFPNHAGDLNELVRTAVFACYQARHTDNHQAIFDRSVDERERHRFRLMVDLERALKEQTGIRLAYQPKIDLASGQCVGVEGLCRWEHSRLGRIPPGEFLPFVEQTSLMMPLTEATLSIGLRDLAEWQTAGFSGNLAINLSPGLFNKADLLERLTEHFRFTNMNMQDVHFEVTETGIMDQPNRAIGMLDALRQDGTQIAVDDFGTGHSSLAYLADLPIDTIKIDKYFIQNLSRPWGRAIVGAATTLADQLSLTTVAEGIETEDELAACRKLGVTTGQGFYLARPMFKEQLVEWFSE